jgi:hypothetical protein
MAKQGSGDRVTMVVAALLSIRQWPSTREAGKLTRSKLTSSGVRFWGSEGGVVTGVGLPTVSTIGQASLMVTARPKGRWRLLVSRRGAVHRWGPRGGGDWAGGRSEVAVHVEVLTAARAEGIWWRRCGPEVDGTGSWFGKLRGTSAQC